jgi:SAM-dependent methyltransferase
MPGSWDPAWETIFKSRAWGTYPSEHVVRFVARHFGAVPDRAAVTLLDLGTGAGGACAWYMAREGFSVAAIEASPTGMDLARQRFAAERVSVDARLGDIITLPWSDATFDGVVDNACLCCNAFANCRRIVPEVFRVLKPGGRFLSANFTDRCSGYGRGREVEPGGFTSRTGSGPLAGDYFTLFMGRAQVDELYGIFDEVVVDLSSFTSGGGSDRVELWLVTCSKAQAGT